METCCSLLAGCAAKEVVVSTLGVLYVGDDDTELLADRLTKHQRSQDMPLQCSLRSCIYGICFIVFSLYCNSDGDSQGNGFLEIWSIRNTL